MYLRLVWTNPILKPSRECSGDVFQVAQKMTVAIGGGWEQESTWHMFPYYLAFTTSPTTKIMFFLWVFIHIGKLCQCQCFEPMSMCNCEISQTSTDALRTTLGSNLSRCNESRHWVGPLSLQAMHKHGRKSLEWHCAVCSYVCIYIYIFLNISISMDRNMMIHVLLCLCDRQDQSNKRCTWRAYNYTFRLSKKNHEYSAVSIICTFANHIPRVYSETPII